MPTLREEALTLLNASGIEGSDAETGLDLVLGLLNVDETDDLRTVSVRIPSDHETQSFMFGCDAMRHARVLRRANAAD